MEECRGTLPPFHSVYPVKMGFLPVTFPHHQCPGHQVLSRYYSCGGQDSLTLQQLLVERDRLLILSTVSWGMGMLVGRRESWKRLLCKWEEMQLIAGFQKCRCEGGGWGGRQC